MRLLAAAVLLLTTACTTGGQPDPPGLPGNYLLESIDGHVLPASSPGEPNVTVLGGSLLLVSGGAFTMSMRARTGTQVPPVEKIIRGSYAADGDALVLSPGQNSTASEQRFRFVRAGTELRLIDPQGHRYRFVAR
jgi:hypothetical protein